MSKEIMKFAYLVCFVALLQVSKSDLGVGTSDTNTTFTDLDTFSDLDVSNSSDVNTTEDSITEVSTPASTTSDEVAASENYSAAVEESTTVEEEEQQPTTVKPAPVHGHAAYLQPSLFALVIPVCLRLSSIKLLSVV